MRVLWWACLAVAMPRLAVGGEGAAMTDGEVWNAGVESYRAGDVTNALRVLRPLMLSKTHGARAAEVVAKLEHDRGNAEEAASAAQIALRANPADARANRNFTRAVDGLAEARETKRINDVLKAAQGKDPAAMLQGATREMRELMVASVGCRTNSAERAVALGDALSARAYRLADTWIPVREAIAAAVTNEEEAATIALQVNEAEKRARLAARELGDLAENAYSAVADSERDFTRFLKTVIAPPAAIGEDLVAQSNAWQDAETVNGRPWQREALDFTRAFRARFPAWAMAYDQAAHSDTNKPPFSPEAQAKISALATELEKIQIECCEKSLPPQQEKALALIREIRDLLPKDSNGSQSSSSKSQPPDQDRQNRQDQKNDRQQDQPQDQPENDSGEGEDQQDENGDDEKDEQSAGEEEERQDDRELEALLKKAQERNDEHEADKKARMRKAPLPPNERDW